MQIKQLHSLFMESGLVSTDTRNILPKSMFFALKGETFNGNRFAELALENGASYAVVDESEYCTDNRCILVENVLTTLQELASFHRGQFSIPVIAITGSNGKTTSKELIREVLSQKYEIGYTKGNLNNHIGVPLTLLELNSNHEIALVEMGDNHPKEVEQLCEIAKPNFGFVTNVGKDHLEGFGSFENNILAKKEVFDYLDKTNGVAFIDASDALVSSMLNSHIEQISYGEIDSFSYIKYLHANPVVTFEDELGNTVTTKLFGAFNFNNIKLAYCIGKYFKVDGRKISDALSDYYPDNNRSQVEETKKNTLIMDAYNANPSSVEEALKSFDEIKTNKSKIAILGDMFELGRYSEMEHRNISTLAMSLKFDEVIFIGENYYKAIEDDTFTRFAQKTEAEIYLKKIAPEGAIILLKGSRGMQLESLKPLL